MSDDAVVRFTSIDAAMNETFKGKSFILGDKHGTVRFPPMYVEQTGIPKYLQLRSGLCDCEM